MQTPGCALALALIFPACGGAEDDELAADEAGDFEDWTWDDESPEPDVAEAAGKRVTVRPGPTTDAERIRELPIGRSRDGAPRRIALRLEPGDLPRLTEGDRLYVPAELQVTTRCDVGQSAAGCDYNPKVAAQILLTGRRDDTNAKGAGSRALSEVETLTCTKNEHHCLFTFRPGDTARDLAGGFALPCVRDNTCHVNLVVWAWDKDARSGGRDKLLIGENEGNYLTNGEVGSDKARIMAVRERGVTGADRRRRETSGGGRLEMPTNTSPRIVYSHRLKMGDVVEGEQFVVEAKAVVYTASRARFSTKLIAVKNRRADEGAVEKFTPTQISEHNGVNCTGGRCVVRKIAAFRATGDIRGPVYINLVAKSAVPGGGSTRVSVARGEGYLRSTRYRAALARAQ